MKSWDLVFTGPRQAEFSQQVIDAPKPGEIQCRACLSLVSAGTEERCLNGVFDEGTNWKSWVQYPFKPGYSMLAYVVAVGDGVVGFKPGDRVFAHAPHCQRFNIDARKANLVPEYISDRQAVWTSMTRITQNGIRRANIQLGDTVVVIGTGIVGLLTMQFAKIAGAGKIIAVSSNARTLAVAERHGADVTVQAKAKNAVHEIIKLTGGRGADVVIDATGNPEVLASACVMARKNGKILVIGDTTEPHKQAFGPGVISSYLTIMGAHSSMFVNEENCFFPYTWERIHEISYNFMRQGRLVVDDIITRAVSPREMPGLYMQLLDDPSLVTGILIDWSLLDSQE